MLLAAQVLGDGDVPMALTVKANAFSASAKEKIEAAGGKTVEAPGRKKWLRSEHEEKAAAAAAAPAKAGKK